MLRPFPSSMRAAAITPADPVGACVARFPTGASLPRFCGGSASALHVSRPARRSLVLRPAWSLNRPWRPVASECFRRCRLPLSAAVVKVPKTAFQDVLSSEGEYQKAGGNQAARGPASTIEHLMVETERRGIALLVCRRAAVTVRRPRADRVPTSRRWALREVPKTVVATNQAEGLCQLCPHRAHASIQGVLLPVTQVME